MQRTVQYCSTPSHFFSLLTFATTVVSLFPANGHAQVERVSGVIDFLETEDGHRMALRRGRGLFRPSGPDLKHYRTGDVFHWSWFPGAPTTFERLFPDPQDSSAVLLVARYRSDGIENRFIYKIGLDDRQVKWGLITQPLDDASYYTSNKGAIFIYSRDGTLIRYFDGRLSHYQIALPDALQKKKGKLREIKCAESSDGTVAFYSIVDPKHHQKALCDVILYDHKNDKWKKIELNGLRTGPAWFIGSRQLRMATPDQIVTLDIDSEKMETAKNPPVQVNGQPTALCPMDVLLDPQNKPVVLMRHFFRSARRYDVDPFEDDKFLKAVQLQTSKNGFTWKDSGLNLGYGLYRPRLSSVDAMGNWWIVGNQAIWRRSNEGAGEWEEYGIRHGVSPPFGTNHVKIDNQNRMWLMNTENTHSLANVIDLNRLESASWTSLSPAWHAFWQYSPLQVNKAGYVYHVDRKNRLKIWTGNEPETIALPEQPAMGIRYRPYSDQVVVSVGQDEIKAAWVRRKDEPCFFYASGQWKQVNAIAASTFARQHGVDSTSGTTRTGSEVRCPVAKSEIRYQRDRGSRMVMAKDRILLQSPDGNWHSHRLDSSLESRLINGRNILANNFGQIFLQRDLYYKSRGGLLVFQPTRIDIKANSVQLGTIAAPNEKINPDWQFTIAETDTVPGEKIDLQAVSKNVLYQWRIDDGLWSRWLPANQPPIVYAQAKSGEHELQVRFHHPGLYFTSDTIRYSFTTEYDFSELVNPLVKMLDSDVFQERQQAARQLQDLGLGVIGVLMKITESGSAEVRANAARIIDAIRSGAGLGNQHFEAED